MRWTQDLLRAGRRSLRGGLDAISAPVGSLVSVRVAEPLVAITLDDGPDPQTTPRMLQVLADADVTATFFVLLSRANLYPEILMDTVAAGHEIGLHGLDHRRLTSLPAKELYHRTSRAKSDLEGRIGREVRWFRPPYGAQNVAVWRAVRRARMTSVFWGPSTWDWKADVDPAERRARALSAARPGAIVLAHDGLADQRDGVEATSPSGLDRAEWLAEVLREYRASGLRGTSVGRLVSSGHATLAARFTR